jgi:pimeloyl-ACP methyl ester carboxylesterase
MIDRRAFSASLAAGAAASLVGSRAAGAQTPAPVRNIVLVHGAYADGSCWAEVIGRLQTAGLNATAVQNPLTSLADDAAATRRILDLQDGPTVLVGHSWGGTVISQAGDHPKVSALVYVAARAPDAGEDYGALAAKYPAGPASAGLSFSGGFGGLNQASFFRDFANGVEPARARILYATQGRVSDTLFAARTTVAAWRLKPSFYAVSRQDRTINPDLERFLAERMKARTIEVDAGHLSMVSHPTEITDLILQAAGRRA